MDKPPAGGFHVCLMKAAGYPFPSTAGVSEPGIVPSGISVRGDYAVQSGRISANIAEIAMNTTINTRIANTKCTMNLTSTF